MTAHESSSQNGSTSYKKAPPALERALRPTQSLLRSSSTTSLNVPPSGRVSRRPSAVSAQSETDISELSFTSTDASSTRRPDPFRTVSYASSTVSQMTSPSVWRRKLHDFWLANYGAFLVLVSQFFGNLMNVSTRLLETKGSHGEPMHPFQILFVRQSITALLCTAFALWTKTIPHFPLGPPGTVRLLLVSRGLCGFFGVFGLYFSLLYLPLSEAVVLTFLCPILSCYAYSMLLQGETFSKRQQMAGFVSLLGVVFIARPASFFSSSQSSVISSSIQDGISPPTNSTVMNDTPHESNKATASQHLQAVGIAMIGVLGGTGAMTSIRAIGTRAHSFISVNYFSVWCTIVSLLALMFVPDVKFRLPGNFMEWGLLSILGFCGFVMQWLLTMGIAYGGPTTKNQRKQSMEDDLELQVNHIDPKLSSANATRGSVVSEAISPSSVPVRHRRHRTPSPKIPLKVSGTRATSMLYTQMLFALASDKIVWGTSPGIWSWIGSSLILGGAIWVAADNSKKDDVEESDSLSAQGADTSSKAGQDVHEEAVGLLRNIDSDDEEGSSQSAPPRQLDFAECSQELRTDARTDGQP